jgi:hypothetical protein
MSVLIVYPAVYCLYTLTYPSNDRNTPGVTHGGNSLFMLSFPGVTTILGEQSPVFWETLESLCFPLSQTSKGVARVVNMHTIALKETRGDILTPGPPRGG